MVNELIFINMKKILLFTLITSGVILLATSCKKDEGISPKSIEGFWSGTSVNNKVPNLPLGILFRDNGTARFYEFNSDTTKAFGFEGTYSYDGQTMQAKYKGYALAAPVNDPVHMDGTFGINPQTTGMGTFSLDKK
jgi:hypothetical protein